MKTGRVSKKIFVKREEKLMKDPTGAFTNDCGTINLGENGRKWSTFIYFYHSNLPTGLIYQY